MFTINKRCEDKSTSPMVCVSIVNWNGKKHLKDCLDSVLEQTYENFEVQVVDNASTDESVIFIRNNYPSVKLLVLDKNYGFAGGYNIAFDQIIKSGIFKYIVILNNDTVVSDCWLKGLVMTAETDCQIGSCASKIIKFQDQQKIECAGFSIYNDCNPSALGFNSPEESFTKKMGVFGAMGAAALYRIAMLQDIKLNGEYFDSDFFAYNEEYDLSWRAKLKGWKCLFVPSAIVYHKGKASFGKMPNFVRYLYERNRLWSIVKDVPLDLLLSCLPYIIAYEALSLVYHTFKRDLPALLRGRAAALCGLRKMVSKRKEIQKSRKVSSCSLRLWMTKRNYLTFR